MCQKAIYPGTFDPVTFGHIDIITRARDIFGEVTVAVAHNPHKTPLFSAKERVALLKKATADIEGVEIDDFTGLVVDYAKQNHAKILIRGLRMLSDFEYEFQMALTNRKFNGNVETIFMMPHESFSYISSRLLKEAVSLGADVTSFVPDFVAKALVRKYSRR
jgi:pantetheine-phosphate adenylyltransferase